MLTLLPGPARALNVGVQKSDGSRKQITPRRRGAEIRMGAKVSTEAKFPFTINRSALAEQENEGTIKGEREGFVDKINHGGSMSPGSAAF